MPMLFFVATVADMETKRSRGRPPLAEGVKKGGVVRFRVNDDERVLVERAAERASVSMSEWILRVVRAAARQEGAADPRADG